MQPAGSAIGNSSISGRGGTSSTGTGSSANVYRHSVFIRGQVELPDGSPAPSDTSVQMRCVGQSDFTDEVDSSGNFSFYFTAISPEAMTGPRRYGIKFGVYVNCQLQAMANGHYSDLKVLSGNDSMGNFLAGTIVLKPKGDREGSTTVSVTNLQAPKPARKAYSAGLQYMQDRKWKQARKQLEKAVAEYPDYTAAWHELGRVCEELKQDEEAVGAYEKAISLDSHYLPPTVRLAAMDYKLGRWKSVLERTGRVIHLNPVDFPDAYFYNAVANFQFQDWPRTELASREAIRLGTHQNHPQVVHILGMSLAQQGRLEEALTELERFLEIWPEASERPMVERQIAAIRGFQSQGR
jgi:Flp pilus assembly protein TadD